MTKDQKTKARRAPRSVDETEERQRIYEEGLAAGNDGAIQGVARVLAAGRGHVEFAPVPPDGEPLNPSPDHPIERMTDPDYRALHPKAGG